MNTVNLNDVILGIESADETSSSWYLEDEGTIITIPADEKTDESRRMIPLPDKKERNDYHTMERFIDTREDPGVREWLTNAIHGRGAFRNFRAACSKFHILNDWYDFEDRCHRDLAVAWCERNGILYELSDDEEEDFEEDVTDFFHEDFREPQHHAQEDKKLPVHLVNVQEDNLMNALYVMDGFRTEVMKQKSDPEAAQAAVQKALQAGCEVIAASDQGRFTGLMISERVLNGVLIDVLYVMKDQRRKGIGSLMVSHLNGAGSVFALSPAAASAQAFLKKEGFASPQVTLLEKKGSEGVE